RFLVDGFDKVVSIILMEDYPSMARVRKATTDSLVEILGGRGSSEALNILDETIAYVRENGPIPANKINIGGRAEKGSWGHGKLSSAALDYLFHDGRIGIHSKKKAQRVYDLSERLYKPEILNGADPFTDEHEFLRWYIKRRIGSIGMVWNKNTGAWLWHFLYNRHPREEIIRELVEDGQLTEIHVEGIKEPLYIRKENEELLSRPAANAMAQVIAPLDNLIWDRGITEQVFDFKYSWEVYIPAAKRQYGYYVLPVLYGNRFVARFEPEKNNGKDPLRIKNWWWEKDVTVTDEMLAAIGDAFRRFSVYLGIPVISEKDWKKKLL
ncbi:MAG: winged helix DNA-binding domain-containing protein, partial [Lachnospiraceae bacterium]|nr:winged helix DNA-binding domain-containing protein [Lachnospiraceae bacterium]